MSPVCAGLLAASPLAIVGIVYGFKAWKAWKKQRPAKFKQTPWGLICTRGGMPPKGPQRVDLGPVMPPSPRNALLLTEIVIDHGNGNRSIFILDERALKAMG